MKVCEWTSIELVRKVASSTRGLNKFLAKIEDLGYNESMENALGQRCPALSPISTCGDNHYKCVNRDNILEFSIK